MKTDEQYDALLKEVRKEIGANRDLIDDAVDLIPLVDPTIMRHYADKLARAGATKSATGNVDKAGAGNGPTDSKTNLAKAMDKRLDTILNHSYKGPKQRTE